MEDVYTYKSYSDIEFDEIDLDFQKQSEEIDFEDLEEWEKKVIIQVLVKDIEEEDRLEQKISRLREELAVLRRRGVIRAGQGGSAPTDRVCGRCRAELGRIINRGAICRGCNVRVCKSCREYTSRSGQDWICPVCQKNKEIAAASGQWVNEFIPNNGRKGGGKVYVPSTAELMKRNIRRSWTISNPTGTEGPMLTPRNQDQRNYHRPDIVPMEDDLHMLGRRAMEDDLQPLQLSSRPVVVAQIPPPPSRVQRFNNVPPPVGAAAVMPLNQPPLARNLPVRTQSLGVGDSGRYTAGRGGPPRFRPPPPPEDRRMFMRRDVAETSSDGEDLFDSGPGDFRSWDRRKFQESRFKAAEPRSKSGGDTQSLERKYNRSATETHSLDRRRRLPEVPSHSLPRPEKRSHSDNRGRGETSRGDDHWRSHSQGDVVDNNRRKLPNLPGSRDIREPTPDYDSSPPPSDSRLGRRNSDSGIPSEKQISVRRHASSIEKAKRPGLGLTSDDEMKGPCDSVCSSASTSDAEPISLESLEHFGDLESFNSGDVFEDDLQPEEFNRGALQRSTFRRKKSTNSSEPMENVVETKENRDSSSLEEFNPKDENENASTLNHQEMFTTADLPLVEKYLPTPMPRKFVLGLKGKEIENTPKIETAEFCAAKLNQGERSLIMNHTVHDDCDQTDLMAADLDEEQELFFFSSTELQTIPEEIIDILDNESVEDMDESFRRNQIKDSLDRVDGVCKEYKDQFNNLESRRGSALDDLEFWSDSDIENYDYDIEIYKENDNIQHLEIDHHLKILSEEKDYEVDEISITKQNKVEDNTNATDTSTDRTVEKQPDEKSTNLDLDNDEKPINFKRGTNQRSTMRRKKSERNPNGNIVKAEQSETKEEDKKTAEDADTTLKKNLVEIRTWQERQRKTGGTNYVKPVSF